VSPRTEARAFQIILRARIAPVFAAFAVLFIEPHLHEAPLIREARLHTHPGGSIDLNTYELTDRILESMLVNRARAGVRVRILLDAAPWHGTRIVIRERAFCARHPDLTCRLAPRRFHYDHAKYVVFDNRFTCIGTANWTWSAFHRNREYIACTGRSQPVRAATRLFHADWQDVLAGRAVRRALIVSPGSELALRSLIGQSRSIEIETEEMGSLPAIDHLLMQMGRHARILLPATLSAWDRRIACKLARHGVAIRLLKRPYLHAKLILTPTRAFIGSQNLTWNSLTRNREVGILIQNPALLKQLAEQFAKDWTRGRALSPQNR